MEYKELESEQLIAQKTITFRNQLISGIIILILIFSFTTITQTVVDRVSVNRIIGGLLVLFTGALFIHNPELKAFIRFVILVISFISCLFVTLDYSKEINDWIFLFATVLMLITISNRRNVEIFHNILLKHIRAMTVLIYIECGILAVLLVTKVGYSTHWGEGTFFHGLCNSQHTMASLCCFIVALILFIAKAHDKNYIWYGLLMLIPSYAIFETGARVFLFPLAVLLFLFVQYGFTKRYIRVLIYIVGIIAAVLLIINSTMMDKFLFVANNQYAVNEMSGFTSGRTEFWRADIELFLNGNPLQILIGRSFSEVYATNLQQVHLDIWAHNDIIHLLVGSGIIGTAAYILIVRESLIRTRAMLSKRSLYIWLVMYVVIPMLLNGFFIYQHYLYSFVILYFVMITKKGSLIR